MKMMAFSETAEKGKTPEIVPRDHLIEAGDESRINLFLEDLQICAFGGICKGQETVEVNDARKQLARRRFDSNFQGYIRAPQIAGKLRDRARKAAILEAFSTKGDWPEVINSLGNVMVMQGEENYDTNYELLFDPALKDPNRSSFEIVDITRGIQFRRIAEGGKVRIEKMQGTKMQVELAWFGAAVGWTEQSIRYREIQTIADKAIAFRDAYQSRRADDHYALVNQAASTGGQETEWSAEGATTADQDAATINDAYGTLLRRFYGKPGYGSATGKRVVYLLHQVEMTQRIHGAMTRRFQAFDGSEGIIRYPVVPLISLNEELWSGLDPSDCIMVVPGIKNKKLEELAPTNYRVADPYSLTYVDIVWTAYAACMANRGQAQLVHFAS